MPLVFTLTPSDTLDKSQQLFNSSHNLHATNFTFLGPVHLTCLLDTSQDADPCQGGNSPLCCLQRCTALRGLPVRTHVTMLLALDLQEAAWNQAGCSQGPELQISNLLMTHSSEPSGYELRMSSEQSLGWVPTRHPQTREHIWYLALPCLSFSTCQMGIIINASHLKNLAWSKCSGHMQQCKPDFVSLAVSFTSPHSPTDVSTADASTGLGKVLLNAWAFTF